IDFIAKGGVDTITVNDLSGTDVTAVNLDLAGVPGTGTGDGSADIVTVKGTNDADGIAVDGSGTSLTVSGLHAVDQITGSEGENDTLTIEALDGDDVVDASGLAAGVTNLTVNGGRGEDILIGSAGNDTFNGGDGDDIALMGAGDDVFVWNPG